MFVSYPRLSKALERVVDGGPVDGRTRLVKLIYLTDHQWFSRTGRVYTEAQYFRWNHGPFAREILAAVEWMDGVEIVQQAVNTPNGVMYIYEPGERTRLGKVMLDAAFAELLDATAERWRHAPLQSLLAHVYGLKDFKQSGFGDPLFTAA